MSDTNSAPALLEGFVLGKSVSSHNGVVCSPAVRAGSDQKYIVKTISVPASAVQLDALLLTGAYSSHSDALEYFRQQAESLRDEAALLEQLSKVEGFLPYEKWQLFAAEGDKLCYELTLIGTFKRTLERYLRSTVVTHLEAVNLGLDLCAALACARRAGYLYIDLKPNNIYISDEKEYKIGDIGFTPLSTLPFTSLPERCISSYTPPELQDALEVINETADTYAVGMILYRVFNNGKLPPKDRDLTLPPEPPAHAGPQISEIILKALAPIPEDRWADPTEMGKALVAYMQQNVINDVPVTDPSSFEGTARIPKIPASAVTPAPSVSAATAVFTPVSAQKAAAQEPSQTPPVPFQPAEPEAAPPAAESAAEPVAEVLPELTVPAPVEIPPEIAELLEPQQPEPAPVPEKPQDVASQLMEAQGVKNPRYNPNIIQMPETHEKKKHPILGFFVFLLVLALLGGAAYGGYWYYTTQYLQSIDDLTVSGSGDELTVTVSTKLDNDLLRVVCTDAYGNSHTSELVNGQAVFTGLNAGSLYNINVEPIPPMKLSGKTNEIYTTDNATTVSELSTVTGTEDGSLVLTVSVRGAEPVGWVATCTAEGQETITQTFTGHTVTLRGLTPGCTYTITVTASDGTTVNGNNITEVTVSKVILAQNIQLTIDGSDLHIAWEAPEDAQVSDWTVRCYSDSYDQSVTVTETHTTFYGVDTAVSYSVEITAAGMTQAARATLSANPITIRSFSLVQGEGSSMILKWVYDGSAPTGGWLMSYTIDGSTTPNVVKCDDASAVISIFVPGSTYVCTVQTADGTSVFGNEHTFRTQEAKPFNARGVNSEKVELLPLPTPEDPDWRADNLDASQFSTIIPAGKKMSLVLRSKMSFYLEHGEVAVRYIFRDAEGHAVLNQIGEDTVSWYDLWFDGDYHLGELNVPTIPTTPGSYTLEVYFDGALFGTTQIVVQ